MLDVDGDGRWDIVSLAEGDSAVKVFRNLGEGRFKEESAAQFGLALKGKGVSCAVGDYDNDGKNDLAVALSDRVVLFHNDRRREVRGRNEGRHRAGEPARGHDVR